MDQNKKTMRHFYCRDVLWETFEQMANDFDCSIDYLVNEAMRYYARSKNYQSAGAAAPPPTREAPQRERDRDPLPTPVASPAVTARPSLSRPPAPPPAPAPPASGNGAAADRRGTVPPTPPRPPAPPRATLPPGGAARAAAADQGSSPLFLVFNNQRFAIDKDQFIIGRGSKTSDLPIKDGNISRKHAAVIRRNGVYYIKDLGSTNGIDYKGMRIDNKRIDEGDVFHLCDYELKFTYRA